MRFEGRIETGELNFITMATHNKKLGAVKSYCNEKKRYIHRCPFSHCPHHDVLSDHVENDPRGIKVSLDTLDTSSIYEQNWMALNRDDDPRQGRRRFVARGAANPKVTSQYRQRAIVYMLERMKGKKDLNKKTQSRLLASILMLEQSVFEDSDSKEKYIENLAIKLFLIFQELERRRRKSSEGTTPYTNLSLAQMSVKE